LFSPELFHKSADILRASHDISSGSGRDRPRCCRWCW